MHVDDDLDDYLAYGMEDLEFDTCYRKDRKTTGVSVVL